VPDYHRKTWAGEVEADLIVVPQIETRRGLDLVDAIAAHEMTTALGIGPYDLGMALGCGLDWAHPTFVDAVAKLNQAARDAGKRMWRIGDAASLAREGCTFPCVGELTGLLDAALRRHVKSAKA
jgi:2-keto-3-deoxy-L-rhamnonate aldolase RhmA